MTRVEKCPAPEGTSKSIFELGRKRNQTLIDPDFARYFGRAKDLPGVKELFQRGGESPSPPSL